MIMSKYRYKYKYLFYVSEQKVVVFVEKTLHIVRDVTRVMTQAKLL